MAMTVRQGLLITVCNLTLAGCGTIRGYDQVPSHEVNLSGSWVLDKAASDDPKKALDALRPKPVKRPWGLPPDDDDMGQAGGAADPSGQQGGGGGGGGGGRGRRGGGQGGGQGQPQMAYRNNNDAYTKVTVMRALTADLARADSMTIRQSPEQFTLDYGSAIRSFTPGGRSVVSAAWGVADQSSGWKGKEYVIQVRPQMGVATTETFSLSDDGKHLIEQLQMGGGDFPTVKLRRVYNQSDKPLQRSVPTSD